MKLCVDVIVKCEFLLAEYVESSIIA